MPRVKAWQRLNLDTKKVLGFSGSFALAAGVGVFETVRSVMAADAPLLSGLVCVVVFYLACSMPRRIETSAALSQALEAPVLAVLGSATLEATHSRTKALLLLRSREKAVSSALVKARRKVLLGYPPEEAVAQAASLASSSTAGVLRSIASPEKESIAEAGEETLAIERSSQLGEETRSPLFIAAAFFVPLMLLLYAVMAHIGEALQLAELVVLQVVLLDVAYYFSTSDPRRSA